MSVFTCSWYIYINKTWVFLYLVALQNFNDPPPGCLHGGCTKTRKNHDFLHQWKFNKISETQIIILVIENKKIHVLQCSSIEFHGTWSAPISMTQAVPLNSMELENRMKNSQLNIFSGLPNLALFWAVRQIFLVFQHPRSLIYANSDFWCSVDAPMCKCFAIMCGTEGNGYVLAKLCPFNIYSTYFDRVFVIVLHCQGGFFHCLF